MTIQHLANAVGGAGTNVWSGSELNPLPDDGQWSELRKKVNKPEVRKRLRNRLHDED
ncbi:hypothetical protein AB0F77_30980 [Streptomyces sp. NPDC026672]|uniref:hypothetical protein n=1 Tax=unclassified Streptomyces TaxID=2593676 RepID=UPI0033D0521C